MERSQRRTHLNAAAALPVTDEDLVGRVALGDVAAFQELYHRVAPAALGIAVRVLRDRAQAEEVMQDALLQVWQSAPSFDRRRAKARTWILTIAHSRATDRVRSVVASKRREQRWFEQADRPHDEVVERVEASLDRERVRLALSSLTELQQQVIELAYFRGYTHQQVAEVLGIPLGTAKTRIRDGLIRLRDGLGVES